jgi:(p)ppGpp synthase/HD superfamily hydrolase
MTLTPRFQEAMSFACQLHAAQVRKGTGVPYIAHLMSVAALVFEDGGCEDEAIAALLHDAVEDQGGAATLQEIYRRFGPRVAGIVEACSDTMVTPKPPWRGRKEAYIRHLQEATPETLRVSLADKVHNARDILACYHQCGEQVWQAFKGGKDGTLWYYHTLVRVFRSLRGGELVDELERVVAEIDRLSLNQ